MAMSYKDQEGEMLTFIKRGVVIASTDYSNPKTKPKHPIDGAVLMSK